MEEHNLDLKNLQQVGRVSVKNPATLATIKQAYAENSIKPDSDALATFRADSTDANEERAFDALSRSDNVNGVHWLLSDFHNTFGNKRVTAIHTKLEDGGFNANMIIDVGP